MNGWNSFRFGWGIVAFAILSGTSTAPAEDATSPAQAIPLQDGKGATFWLIPHTHWEGAVFKTREEYLEMGLPNILTAVRLLKEHPDYRFALDQVAYFRPFLERYPEEAQAFRRFVAEGRLQMVGGMDIMPDDNMPAGESFVRQVLYAKTYCREVLGTDVKVGWLLDTFGHNAQMPQILKQAGFESFWFFRGVPDREKMPSEFLWEGLDGTRIRSFWLPFAYGHLYGSPTNLTEFSRFVEKRYADLAPFARGPDRVGLAGIDVSEPELHVPLLVEQYNRQPDRRFTLRIGVPGDFERAVASRPDLPVLKGERNPIFQGVYSSRIELKQTMREMERLLTLAEKLAVLGNTLGESSDDTGTWRAWEPCLFNVTHDLASGVMTDAVYEDTLRSYDFSRRLADGMIERRLDRVLSHIDTRGDGIPLVVFNPLGWERTDAAQAEIGFAEGGVLGVEIRSPDGARVPAQLTETSRYQDGSLRQVRLVFRAAEVPAIGFGVYHALPLRTTPEDAVNSATPGSTNALSNEFYELQFDPETGALIHLTVQPGGWEALAGAANVVAREADHGDFWELYRNLDGFQNVMMTRPVGSPVRGEASFTDEPATNLAPASIERGPVFSEFHLRRTFGRGTFSSAVRLYAGMRRIEFLTTLRNQDERVRYRAVFPTAIRNGQRVDEIPFGAVSRPECQEFPAQNWIDSSDGERGVALLNRGLPGNNVCDGTLLVSLLRSTRIQSYGVGGGYERQSSDSGLELGQDRTFRYALLPHSGDWRGAGITRAAAEFNHPLVVRKAAVHSGRLPARWGLLEITEPGVVLSTLKPGKPGAMVLRVYEARGQEHSDVAIRIHARIEGAWEANLMEDPGHALPSEGDTLRLALHPFEIKTLVIRVAALSK